MKLQRFEDESGLDSRPSNASKDLITIKIKKSDNQIVKVGIVPDKDTVKDLKERAFRKEREENKNVRLIYQGKILQDGDPLAKYNIQDGAFVHAFITESVAPKNNEVNNETQQNMNNQSVPTEQDERLGFDRLLQNGAYSEIEVHAIRLQFHSIMMRVGIEKTNETSESLLENEEKWLNKQIPGPNSKFVNMSLDELRQIPTVLSLRNDLVLPRYYFQPASFERDGTYREFATGFFIGLLLSAPIIVLYLIWQARPSKNVDSETSMSKLEKFGIYSGAFANFCAIYLYLYFMQ